jgi:DNA repair protein RecN (Recombination protein N)
MLLELHMAGLGVIDDVTLELAPGLNVLTGETGAGKTMVTEGLALVLGGRARSGPVRSGTGEARIEARFGVDETQLLSGMPTEEVASHAEQLLAEAGRERP